MEEYNNTTSSITEVPLVVVYFKLFIMWVVTLTFGIPSGLVIRVIVKETELHTKYYFILVLLLVCDMLYVFGDAITTSVALLLYLIGVNITINCTSLTLIEMPQLVAQLLCAVMGIDRYIAIAYPFQHKQIMSWNFTGGLITTVCVLAIGAYSVIISTISFQYVPSMAQCIIVSSFPVAYMLMVFLMLLSTGLVIAINIYLYYKVLETNRKHRDNMRLHGAGSRATSKLEALRTRLREQVKPTVSILLLGGLDGIFNIILLLTYVSLGFVSDSIVRDYVVVFWVIPLHWLQIMCHPLVYGL